MMQSTDDPVPGTVRVRNARAEATALLPPGTTARVLEPSPPSDTDPRWFADDPTDPADADGPLLTPIPGEGTEWSHLTGADQKSHAARHWLDGRRRPAALPDSFAATREAIHQIAFFAVAPKRFEATGKLGLRYTSGGLGTPFFGDDEQVRIEGDTLVHQHGDQVRSTPLTTVRAATTFLGLDYRPVWFDGFHDPLSPADPDTPLEVDAAAAASLADWFGFSTHVLERARRAAPDASRVQLWPEHLDPAFEMGDTDTRASYGGSPGDAAHPEPYLYVAAWGTINRSDRYWNDEAFNGASLTYGHLLAADDPYDMALRFLADGHRRLTA
jgi:hypothetical protein